MKWFENGGEFSWEICCRIRADWKIINRKCTAPHQRREWELVHFLQKRLAITRQCLSTALETFIPFDPAITFPGSYSSNIFTYINSYNYRIINCSITCNIKRLGHILNVFKEGKDYLNCYLHVTTHRGAVEKEVFGEKNGTVWNNAGCYSW